MNGKSWIFGFIRSWFHVSMSTCLAMRAFKKMFSKICFLGYAKNVIFEKMSKTTLL